MFCESPRDSSSLPPIDPVPIRSYLTGVGLPVDYRAPHETNCQPHWTTGRPDRGPPEPHTHPFATLAEGSRIPILRHHPLRIQVCRPPGTCGRQRPVSADREREASRAGRTPLAVRLPDLRFGPPGHACRRGGLFRRSESMEHLRQYDPVCRAPAEEWLEGLPLGNGNMGAPWSMARPGSSPSP